MEGKMTDHEVETLIWDEIRKRGITFGDMIAPSNHGVDPTPEAGDENRMKRLRRNIFDEDFGSERTKEILCLGEYSSYDDYPPLKIPFHDLFRFWWNHCVTKELVVDDVLEEIFEYFKERMRPVKEEEPEMEMAVDFEKEAFHYPEKDGLVGNGNAYQ
jgi:hypothetical protein